MGWLPLVGSLKLQVSFAKEPYKGDNILQKRPSLLRSLLIVCESYVGAWLRGWRLGRAMNLVDRLRTSTDERVLSGRLAVVIAWWAVVGLVVPHWPFGFSWTVILVILGLAFLRSCRARLLRLCAPLLSLQSFYNYTRGHCEVARSFYRAMHSIHLISVEQ